MSCKVSFIGLGVMGYPMAGYISKAGHNVTVYNRTKSKAEKWVKEFGGQLAETPKDAAKDSDFVFTCVGNDKDLEEVTIGKSGIYNSTICSSSQLNHAVLAIGYGETFDKKKYIMIKNSWGVEWGMDGYIYMSTDIDNLCGIAQVASYPIV